MVRNTFAWKIQPGKYADFVRTLGESWTGIKAFLDENQVQNFSVWNAEDMVFGYCECDYEFNMLTTERKDILSALIAPFEKYIEWVSTPWVNMRLMYQDFGIIRKSKELIRHRVFITKLVPGSEEEYKKRHDALVEARGDVITKGPDSNFSIWNAGGYIFGYDEIDTTMERDRTEEDRQADIAWETRMFEIMSWITNDVDWISGECHAQIRRLCYHN